MAKPFTFRYWKPLLLVLIIALAGYSIYQQKEPQNAAGLIIPGNDDSYAKAIEQSYELLVQRYVVPLAPKDLFLSAQAAMELVDQHWLKQEQKIDEEAKVAEEAKVKDLDRAPSASPLRAAPAKALPSRAPPGRAPPGRAPHRVTLSDKQKELQKEQLKEYPASNLKKKYRNYLQKSRREGYYSHEFAKQLYIATMVAMGRPMDDPFSGFFQNGDFYQLSDTTNGSFGGIGVYITKLPFEDEGAQKSAAEKYQLLQRHYVKISRPILGGPSFRAGIQADDFIYAVNGESAKDWTVEQIQNRVRGIPGSKVKITVLRARKHKVDFEVTREKIEVSAVRTGLIPMDGAQLIYVDISQFNMLVAKQFDEQVRKLLERESDIAGLILDMRSNPGGLLNMAVEISNQFLGDGVVVSTDARTEENMFKFMADKKTTIPKNLPVFVMLNSESASAAEIVAGALQDHKRAEVIGEKSFGKGSVQVPVTLPEGILKITIAHFYTPKGINLANNGIVPDFAIEPIRLSQEEGEARLQLYKDGLVVNFVSQNPDYSEAEFAEFSATQIEGRYRVSLDLVKRMAYEERMRFMKELPVYNLEYDNTLEKAVAYIAKKL